MSVTAIFGIDGDGLNLVVNLLILFLVVVWFALIYWTYADARRRMTDPMLIGCAAAASAFPFVGTLVYLIVRPPEYLDDVRERELEIQAAQARLVQSGFEECRHCNAPVERDFLRCPGCMRRLKDPCPTCGRPLERAWRLCPYCETEILREEAAPSRATRGRAATEAPPMTEAARMSQGPPPS